MNTQGWFQKLNDKVSLLNVTDEFEAYYFDSEHVFSIQVIKSADPQNPDYPAEQGKAIAQIDSQHMVVNWDSKESLIKAIDRIKIAYAGFVSYLRANLDVYLGLPDGWTVTASGNLDIALAFTIDDDHELIAGFDLAELITEKSTDLTLAKSEHGGYEQSLKYERELKVTSLKEIMTHIVAYSDSIEVAC